MRTKGNRTVCLITENHPLVLMGGAEYQTDLLAEELAMYPNTTVHYLARRVPEPEAAATLAYKVHKIGNDRGIRRRAVFFDVPQLARVLQALQPDVVYEQMKQSYAAVCAWYARRKGVPFFLHMASEWDLDPSLIPHGWTPNTPFNAIEAAAGNFGLVRASHLVIQTEAQGEKLRHRFGVEPALLVRNFQPIPDQLSVRPPGPLRILWVGNIKPVKRPELFVELAKNFRDRIDLHFDMVGRPWNHPSTRAMMNEIASLPNLKFHGELPIDRVNELMSAASFYVNTSEHEGFPNTFIQAWARGAVLLSMAVDPYGGMDGLGIGFLTGTLDRMKKLIEELATQPERRRSIAERSFHLARQNHSMHEGTRLADAMLEAADSYRSDRI